MIGVDTFAKSIKIQYLCRVGGNYLNNAIKLRILQDYGRGEPRTFKLMIHIL